MTKLRASAGFTLVEMLLASAVLALMVLALFESIIIATRIAHENSEYLAAEAIAWDAAWKCFNQDYGKLRISSDSEPTTYTEQLTKESAPALMAYDTPPKLTVEILGDAVFAGLKCVRADVEWGNALQRRKVSDVRQVMVARGEVGRVE